MGRTVSCAFIGSDGSRARPGRAETGAKRALYCCNSMEAAVQEIDTLINARWIVPIEPAGAVLDEHALAIDGDRIVALLPQGEAKARYRARTVHHLPDHTLLPGLANAHSHVAMTLLHDYAEDLTLKTLLTEHMWYAKRPPVIADLV